MRNASSGRRLSYGERLMISAGMTIIGGWEFMLAVGVIHHEWIAACPTIGFWWALLLSFLLRAAMAKVQPPPRGGAA